MLRRLVVQSFKFLPLRLCNSRLTTTCYKQSSVMLNLCYILERVGEGIEGAVAVNTEELKVGRAGIEPSTPRLEVLHRPVHQRPLTSI